MAVWTIVLTVIAMYVAGYETAQIGRGCHAGKVVLSTA